MIQNRPGICFSSREAGREEVEAVCSLEIVDKREREKEREYNFEKG